MIPQFTKPAGIDIDPLVTADSVLIALDFDGVLAPLQDDPEASRMLPDSAEAIAALTTLPGTRVALVSGRALSTLRRLASPPPAAWLIGSHGAEADLGEGPAGGGHLGASGAEPKSGGAPDLSESEARLLEDIDAQLAELSTLNRRRDDWRLRIEEKPFSRTLHTRGLDPEFIDLIEERLPHVGARFPQLRIIEGHDIVEYSVKTATKGDGMRMLIGAGSPDAIAYLGDDVTDEDAFAELEEHPQHLCIKVGASATRAPWRIEDPRAVAELLNRIVRERGSRRS